MIKYFGVCVKLKKFNEQDVADFIFEDNSQVECSDTQICVPDETENVDASVSETF